MKAAAEVARRLSRDSDAEISAEAVLESPYSLIGSVGDLVSKLRRIRERWGINFSSSARSTNRTSARARR